MDKKWRFLYFKWEDYVVFEACLKILLDECISYDARFEYGEYCTLSFACDDITFNSMRETMAEMYDYELKGEEL